MKPDDRLLQINSISLDGFSNDKAMETLRNALKESVKQETQIKIVVSRKSKSEHNHMVTDGKPELQASVRPSVLSLEQKGEYWMTDKLHFFVLSLFSCRLST